MDFTCFIVHVLLLNLYILINVFFFSFFFLQDQPKETVILSITHPVKSRVVGGLLELVGICDKIRAVWNDISLACQTQR